MPISLGFSIQLASLTFIMATDRVSLGVVGEQYAKILLEAHGYLAEIDHQRRRGDLRVTTPDGEILRVEVKTARLSKRKYFEYGLKIFSNGRLRTDCTNCDALLLLGVRPTGLVEFYVVPVKAAANIKVIKIPGKKSRFHSNWKQYRQFEGSLNLNAIVEANRELMDSRDRFYRSLSTVNVRDYMDKAGT